MSEDTRSILYIRVDSKLKKELKLISVYEDTNVTDIVLGFINDGLRHYKVTGELKK